VNIKIFWLPFLTKHLEIKSF